MAAFTAHTAAVVCRQLRRQASTTFLLCRNTNAAVSAAFSSGRAQLHTASSRTNAAAAAAAAASTSGEPFSSVKDMLEAMKPRLVWGSKCSAKELNKLVRLCDGSTESLDLTRWTIQRYRQGLMHISETAASTAVLRFCKVDRAEDALDMVCNKKQFGLFPSRNAYNVLMGALSKAGQHSNAVAAFDQLVLDLVHTPNAESYRLVVRACRLDGSEEMHTRAMALVNAAEQQGGGAASTALYSELVLSYLNQGNVESASSLFSAKVEQELTTEPQSAKARAAKHRAAGVQKHLQDSAAVGKE